MTKKTQKYHFSNFGFSTILLSFVMICVVTFSALSLVTAHSDYRLSQKVADKTLRYYAAEEKAFLRLSAIDSLLANCYLSSGNSEAYFKNVTDLSSNYGTFETTSTGHYILFQEEIDENQYFSVKLLIQYPDSDTDSFYEITEWKSVYNQEIPEDQTLNLIQ